MPSPAVVCTPTPALSVTRNKLTCTPETRSPEGLSTDTLRSDARAAVRAQQCDEKSTNNGERRRLNMTLLLCTRKGFGDRSSRRSPGWRVAIGIADSGGAFPFAQWPYAKTRLQLRGSAGFTPASQFRR